MILLITSFVIFWGYVGFTYFKFGWLSSISATVDRLKYPILFSLFEWGIALPIIYEFRDVSVGVSIGGLLIFGVGLFPALRIKTSVKQDILHVICATGGILAAYTGVGIELVDWKAFYMDVYFWTLVAFLISAIIILPLGRLKKPVKNHTTVIEIAAYNIIMIAFFIKMVI